MWDEEQIVQDEEQIMLDMENGMKKQSMLYEGITCFYSLWW